MKRVIFAVLSTVTGLVMLLSFKTHAVTSTTVAAAAVSRPSVASGSPGTTSSGATSKTVTGKAVDTRWGPVQVQITVTGKTITSAQAVVYPQSNPRDQEINAYAIPTLNSEAQAASSAAIDMVSGATFTSQGYIASLQSALDTL